ncbi:unnamed protein product [Cylicocyclus nassatus]|uniref:Uncharacterized protein n=1 Tax=Cylicocyclus nassatus TaxID=53992 RepID=A0AA36HIJ5_CYLNA|nr:unnamed protein product [Cylicocyclus nassatus]
MASRVAARASSPVSDDLECMDMVHPMKSSNNLPLTSTTPSMPPIIRTTDRPVVLYMAPVHKLRHADDPVTTDADVKSSLENMQLK